MVDRHNIGSSGCGHEDCTAEMENHPKGDYVEWDDYETLLDGRNELLEAYEDLRKQLQDVLDSALEFSVMY